MISLRRRFSAATRLWILIAGVGQAMMPGIASIADASPGAASVTAAVRPHIESHGTPKCPRVHQEDTCALCQFVSSAVAGAAHAAPLPLDESSALRIAEVRPETPSWRTAGAPDLPRAPPVPA